MTLYGNGDDVKRRYRSPLRAEQTRVTRKAILDAAHELFLTNGYANTSVKRVATLAGVSEQTVYNTFGDKPGLLYAVGQRVVSGQLAPEGNRSLASELRDEPNPERRIEIIAEWSRMTSEQGMLEFESMLLDAAGSDPRVTEVAAQAWRQKYEDTKRVFPLVFPDEVRNDDFALQEALDLVFAIDSAAFTRTLIEDRDWSWDKYERLLAVVLRRLFARISD